METPQQEQRPRDGSARQLKLITCEIFYREMCASVARSRNKVDVEFLPKGLHDIGSAGMLERLQGFVDGVDASRYEAVLLGYGLCGNGIDGLTARSLPLVIPRAHDCMTFYFGSKERYMEYFKSTPGVYFKTSGWIERGTETGELKQLSISHKLGIDMSYEDMVARYGERNAKFLQEKLGDLTPNYSKLTFIEMGIEPDDRFERETREEAAERGWGFEKLQGDMSLFESLVDGRWDSSKFLVVSPGSRVAISYDGDDIIKAVESA